jgi:uncharacterized protein with HEPN domain
MKKDDRIYLSHVLERIGAVEESLMGIRLSNFVQDGDLQDATIRRIEVIGEAVKNISPSLKKKYPLTQWRTIAGTRDVLIHAYFSVDTNMIYDIAKRDLPVLKKQVEEILSEMD